MPAFRRLHEAIEAEGAAALVTLAHVEGSTPRERDAFMVVRPSGGFHGTIGGGALEYEAIDHAREALARQSPTHVHKRALGPDLGQCCGGRVTLRIECFDRSALPDIARWRLAERDPEFRLIRRQAADGSVARRISDDPRDPQPGEEVESYTPPATPVLLFGAGHVGRALVLALAPLPFSVRLIDPRPDWFPPALPANVQPVAAPHPPVELATAPEGAMIVVMTHSHALDLDIVATALQAGRFPYVGVIGSSTKRARFESRLRAMDLAEDRISALVCPIGAPLVHDKTPPVIAAMVAAELLGRRG